MIYSIFTSTGALKKVVDVPPNIIHLQLEDGDTYIEGNTEYFPTEQDNVIKMLSQRTMLLVTTDWTQLPDVPLATKEAWATYRQALRDITDQPGYPTDIEWPVSP